MERRRSEKKRTVISRVIAPPDMTGTREAQTSAPARGGGDTHTHTENLRERRDMRMSAGTDYPAVETNPNEDRHTERHLQDL